MQHGPGAAGSPSISRLAALDALRGIAALNVVLLHFTTDFHRDFSPARESAVSWVIGNYGVHLFFLISGFVILMSAERAKGPRDFAVSRFSRLYPPYWLAVVLTTVVLIAFPVVDTPDAPRLLRRAIVGLTMFQSWVGIGSVDSVYWTLQVEMSFYLILLLLIWRRAVDKILGVMTALVVVALLDQVFVARPLGDAYTYVRQILFLDNAYLFATGIVIYKLRHGFRRRYAVILALCALCPATADFFPHHPPIDTLMAVLLAGTVYLATTDRLSWLVNAPLLFLGRISYSLYLIHHWIGLIFLHYADRLGVEPNLALVLSIALCVSLAAAMTRYVEQPSLRWMRERLAQRRHDVPATTRPEASR
jgi:peptidoglycan/LPS O-acetylase OafA/YrhL